MAIADAPARTGARLAIAQAGRSCTYKRAGEATENTTTGVVTVPTTDETLTCVLGRVRKDLIDGTLIRATDLMALIDAESFEAAYGATALPAQEDRIEVAGEDLQIVAVLPVSSGEQWALHKLIVRR